LFVDLGCSPTTDMALLIITHRQERERERGRER